MQSEGSNERKIKIELLSETSDERKRQFGIRNNAIAHIDLFPNALFSLFTLSADKYIPS